MNGNGKTPPANGRHTFVVHVEDKPGVLNRVASLFRRRGFNIESLTVGHSEAPGVSRMTFVSNGLVYLTEPAVSGYSGSLWILRFSGNPRLQSADLVDTNDNGTIEAGDQLILTMTRSVIVSTSTLQAGHFFLPVAGDSLGGAGFGVSTNPYNLRQIALHLGEGAKLKAVYRLL